MKRIIGYASLGHVASASERVDANTTRYISGPLRSDPRGGRHLGVGIRCCAASFAEIGGHFLQLTTSTIMSRTGEEEMSKERANDLARQCTELVRKGNDFPAVWATLLKSHALVDGTARQRLECTRSLLDIPLITGEQLVYDADVREFRVQ